MWIRAARNAAQLDSVLLYCFIFFLLFFTFLRMQVPSKYFLQISTCIQGEYRDVKREVGCSTNLSASIVNYERTYPKMTRGGEIKNFKFNFQGGKGNPILFYKIHICPPPKKKLHFLKKKICLCWKGSFNLLPPQVRLRYYCCRTVIS